MKKNSIHIGITLLYLVTGCSNGGHNTTYNLASSSLRGGGNPEVKSLPQCFKLKNRYRDSCFDIFYPGDINIFTYPAYGKKIRLAGRKSSIEKKEFNLVGQERFIIAVDVSKVKLPLQCNIPTALQRRDGETLTIDIPVKDIEKKVIFRDKEGKLLLQYSIIK